MKLVFMGTPDFAVPCLQRAVSDGHEVAAVFTQPDKPQGRKFIITPPPVKVAAEKLGIPVFQPKTLRDASVQAQLCSLAPDVIVVVAYAKLLPKEVLAVPRFGCVNVHGSLLPKYRGAAPIQWSVINGDAVAGVTTMYMAEGLDSGDMIESLQLAVDPDETSGQLFERLMPLGAQCLSTTLKKIEAGTAPRVPQDDTQATLAPKIDKSMGKLDFTKPARQLHNLVRGLSPWPNAFMLCGQRSLKVLKTAVRELNGPAGTLLKTDGFVIACGQDALEIAELVPEGKGKMTGAQFLQGLRDRPECF